MFVYGSPFLGMHLLWWFFWIVIWVSFFSFLTPVSRRRMKEYREPPRDTLLRRFSRGEISEQDYERAKVIIERDMSQNSTRPARDSKGAAIGNPLASR